MCLAPRHTRHTLSKRGTSEAQKERHPNESGGVKTNDFKNNIPKGPSNRCQGNVPRPEAHEAHTLKARHKRGTKKNVIPMGRVEGKNMSGSEERRYDDIRP